MLGPGTASRAAGLAHPWLLVCEHHPLLILLFGYNSVPQFWATALDMGLGSWARWWVCQMLDVEAMQPWAELHSGRIAEERGRGNTGGLRSTGGRLLHLLALTPRCCRGVLWATPIASSHSEDCPNRKSPWVSQENPIHVGCRFQTSNPLCDLRQVL